MNIRQVEIFKAIMDYGSVTEAATRLHVTQPSVSKHLKLLEYHLGFDLFIRSGNRLLPTPEGQALYDQIGRLYTGLEQLDTFVEDLKKNRHGEITIASLPLLSQFWLPQALTPFLMSHDTVSISLPVRSSKWIGQTVAARKADFGLALNPGDQIPGVISEQLMSLPLVCVMRADHPLAQRAVIEVADLEHEDVISLKNFDHWRLALEKLLETRKNKPKRNIDTFSTQVACELVRNGVGIALVDVLSAANPLNSQLVIRPFAADLSLDICVLSPEHWPLSRLAAHLKDSLTEQAVLTRDEMKNRFHV